MVSEKLFITFEFQKPDEDTCGAVSIVNVLKNLEIEASLQSILEKLAISPMDKTHAPQLAVCLNQFHLDIVVVSSNPFVTPADWKGLSSNQVAPRLEQRVKLLKNGQDSPSTTETSGEVAFLKNSEFLLQYLQSGGELEVAPITQNLIDRFLDQGYLLIAGCTDSELWGKLKIPHSLEFDDIRGRAGGHFVVVFGKDNDGKHLISDPYPTGISESGNYPIDGDTLISSLYWALQIVAVRK